MTLTPEEILSLFKETGALLEGHFVLTSGLHSDRYFQCAKILQYPWHAETLCKALADHFSNVSIDLVVSPAIGGILVGQEIARWLHVRAIFAERVNEKLTLRRGFEIFPGEKVLIAEDVTTTGGSVQEVMEIVKSSGGIPVGIAGIVDRSGGNIHFEVPYYSLLKIEISNFQPTECPLCKAGSIPVKPGSRGLK